MLLVRGEYRTGIGRSGTENKKPDRVSGDFGGPDIRYFGGRGFRVSGVSGRLFGAPDLEIFFGVKKRKKVLEYKCIHEIMCDGIIFCFCPLFVGLKS